MCRILAAALLPLMLLTASIGMVGAEPLPSRSVPLIVVQNGPGSPTSRTGINTTTQTKAPTVRQDGKPKPDLFTKEQMVRFFEIAFVVLGSCTTILFVLGCGSRVVVFANRSDAIMSSGMIIAPIVTMVVSGGLLWILENPADPKGMTGVEFFKAYPSIAFVAVVGAGWWLWSILGTLISSIRHNGLILGLIVSVLKIGAVLSFLIVGWVALTNYDEEGNLNHYTAKFFIFAALAWFASKMVNGKRVRRRRMESDLSLQTA